jgi:hypothetical protein
VEGLARSTALYRLAEEVLEVERDREAAAELFWQLAERYPESPWRPFAMLASGKLLAGGEESIGTGVARMLALIELFPDHQASDSARREMGFDVPARPGDFYASDPTLMVLTRVLPPAGDPMLDIEDQMNRYGARVQSSPARLRGAGRDLEVERERGQDETPAGEEPQAPPLTDPKI